MCCYTVVSYVLWNYKGTTCFKNFYCKSDLKVREYKKKIESYIAVSLKSVGGQTTMETVMCDKRTMGAVFLQEDKG